MQGKEKHPRTKTTVVILFMHRQLWLQPSCFLLALAARIKIIERVLLALDELTEKGARSVLGRVDHEQIANARIVVIVRLETMLLALNFSGEKTN